MALVGGWNGGEREGEKKLQKQGKKAGFWPTLDLIFSSLRPSNPPLFIGDARGQVCLHYGKFSAFDSVGKDPNRWFKVSMVHCQICRKRLPEVACLGRRRRRWVVIQPNRAIWGCRASAEDLYRARFVKFDGC